jgi:hypothetical protein
MRSIYSAHLILYLITARIFVSQLMYNATDGLDLRNSVAALLYWPQSRNRLMVLIVA